MNCVEISPDGSQLASASDDETVRVILKRISSFLACFECSLTINFCSFVQVWDLASGQITKTLTGHKDWVMSVTFSPDGSQLASGSIDNTIKVI